MRANVLTLPDYLAQSTGQVTAVTLMTALITLFVVFTIAGAVRHPSGPGLVNLLILAMVMYVGWSAARWRGVDYSQGMFLGVFHMWLDSLRTVWDFFWGWSGLDSLSQRLGTLDK